MTHSLPLSVDIDHSANFSANHTTSKTESINRSVFSALVWPIAWRILSLTAFQTTLILGRQIFFADMLNLGLNKIQSEALLNAKRWDARMALAWSHLTPAERKLAQNLTTLSMKTIGLNLTSLNLIAYAATHSFTETMPISAQALHKPLTQSEP